jgi:uncharacterized protein (DUF2267 family)
MHDELIAHVTLHSGLDEAEARAATDAVLRALATGLGRPEAEALAAELPDELGRAVRESRYAAGTQLAAQVASLEHVALAVAVEHVASVCHALAELLPETTLERLRRGLPGETAALLEPPAPAASARAHGSRPLPRNTLAEGRPGSRHPISESRPPGAHANSVVASDNPHGDTKLSSSRGLTQERERETLATGKPGTRRDDE